jgi:segregation and condensation protein A
MPQAVKLEKFEGPLDLLLQLIEDEKMAITDVSLATVTEQFFAYIQTIEDDRSEELADFLVIATRLVYIKSKQLLPYLYPPEEEGTSLADQLKFYKRYADASKWVEKRWNSGVIGYGRIETPPPMEGFVLPANAQPFDLRAALYLLLKRLRPINPLPQVTIDKTVSVKQKIASIYEALKNLRSLSFREMISTAESKTEVIVSFLALLELVKDAKVSIEQDVAFNDMVIQKI